MAVQRASSLLLSFKSKIEESVALVPDMVAEEKLKAVQFWNVVSERLQQIVNDSAADINALALNMHGEDISVATLGDQETQAKMSQPYMETHAYRSENLYTEAIEGFDVAHATSGGHQQELLALSAELEQVVPTQQPPTPANFGAVPLEHGLSVTPESLPKDSAVLLISTQASDDQASFDVAPQQSHVPLPQQDYGNVLQIGVKTASFQEHKEAPEEWQSCLEYAPKSKPQRKRRPSAKKAAKGYIKRIASLGGKRAAGASILGEPGHADASALDARLQGGQNVETTEVIVIQTRKRPKKTREGKDKQCKICLKELPNNSSLTTHMWTHEKPFACTECSACFSTKNNLIVHQRSHSGEKPYACGECSASFSTRGNLKRHVKTHTGVKPWKCSHCEQCFTEKKTLVAHMRRHTGEKPYQCQVCQRRFAQSGVLQTHMAVHLGHKAHLCEHCGKAFRQRSQLRLHMQRHQGLRRYSCTICPSRFLTKADMLRHERTHTGERPYGCTLCGKKFTRQQSLNEHTNRHYGIKPFECKYCDKTFAEMSACYKHIKLHSKNENGENAEGAQSSAKASEASFPATSLVPAAETVQLCPAPAASGTRGEGSEQRVLQREATLQPLLQQQQRRRQQSPAPGTADVAGMGSTAEVSATDLLAAASGF